MPTKVHLVKAMFFPVVMHGWESWILKKAKHKRIDTFELWCRRRLLRVPWTAKRSNKPILKEISPRYSLKRLMLKLKLQYFGSLLQRIDSFEKKPDAGKDWRWEEKGMTEDEMGWMTSLNQWTRVWVSSRSWLWTGKLGMLQSMGSQRVRHDWATELKWTNCGTTQCTHCQWFLWLLLLDHSPGNPVCFWVARWNLCPDLMPGCDMEWMDLECQYLQFGKCSRVEGTSPRLSLSSLLACQHACISRVESRFLQPFSLSQQIS